METQMETFKEHDVVAQRLNAICETLPWCQGVSWRFSDLQQDALSDLYAALEGLSIRFCELLGLKNGSVADESRTLGVSLAMYLYDHPDRCHDTLQAIMTSAAEISTPRFVRS